MKDFFGTVIAPGDAVIVARGAYHSGRLTSCGELQLGHFDGDGNFVDSEGKTREYSLEPASVVSIKSIASRAGIGIHGGGRAAEQ